MAGNSYTARKLAMSLVDLSERNKRHRRISSRFIEFFDKNSTSLVLFIHVLNIELWIYY